MDALPSNPASLDSRKGIRARRWRASGGSTAAGGSPAASAQVKPAELETGLVVTVPSFINTGDAIRVNTETGEYLSRV